MTSGFFGRDDERPDTDFYRSPRLVRHIDNGAIAAAGRLYAEFGVDGSVAEPHRVLDLMSSWISHLESAPTELVVLGLNAAELDANPMASARVVHDLNADPALPFAAASFDAVLCCVSIDYLTHPIAVLAEVARVLRPDAPVLITFSNRCFPTKAVHGWLATDDRGRAAIVVEYLRRSAGFTPAEVTLRTPPGRDQGGRYRGDPLWAVTARRLTPDVGVTHRP